MHKSCLCPDRLTLAGTVNKTQPKLHVSCNNETDPLIKAYQRGTSAAIRGAVTWKKQKPEEYSNRTLESLTIQGIEEMVNHLSNIHDGPGFVTGEPASGASAASTRSRPRTASRTKLARTTTASTSTRRFSSTSRRT